MGAFMPNPLDSRDNGGVKVPYVDLCAKYMSSLEGFRIVGVREGEEGVVTKKKRNGGLQLKIKVSNPSLKRLISGGVSNGSGVAGDDKRAHLMVGSSRHSSTKVFQKTASPGARGRKKTEGCGKKKRREKKKKEKGGERKYNSLKSRE
jgi:hypothetical protein